MEGKRVRDSQTEQVHILMSAEINGSNRLFGGVLMQWIDVVAAVVARRHSGHVVTTASVDGLEFLAPAYLDDTILLDGKLTFVGNSCMEVSVKTYVEALNGARKLVNHAHMVLVAVDENGKPVKVPPLIIETDEERAEWEAGKKRYEARKKRRLKQLNN